MSHFLHVPLRLRDTPAPLDIDPPHALRRCTPRASSEDRRCIGRAAISDTSFRPRRSAPDRRIADAETFRCVQESTASIPPRPCDETACGFQPDSVLITAFTSAGSTLWRSAASRTMRSIGSVNRDSVACDGSGPVADESAVAGIAGGNVSTLLRLAASDGLDGSHPITRG